MKIHDIVEGKSENRQLWDRIKTKGVVPNIDRERYTDMSDQGLEGPFRMKNGQVLYYDPKEGKYYNRDTDMYVDYDDYRAMDEAAGKTTRTAAQIRAEINKIEDRMEDIQNDGGRILQNDPLMIKLKGLRAELAKAKQMKENYAAASKKAEASRQRGIKRAAAAYKRHGDMDRAIKDHDLFARDADKIKSLAGDKVDEQQLDEISSDTMKSYNKKAFTQYMNMTHGPTDWNKQPDKVRHKAAQRMRGMNMADRKLKKQEQIEEKFVVVDGDKKILHVHGTLGAANKKAQAKGLDPEEHVMTHVYWQHMHGPRSKRNKEVKEGDKRPGYVVSTKDKPKKFNPSKGGESPHPYQGKLVGEAEVSNTDYEFTHGRKPSGKGSWFFVAHRGGIDFRKDVEGEDYIQLNQMSYSDAKKAAVKWAKSKGHTSLFVAT